ncbi:hypothetical protein EX30DRAFT_184779 [Ascodesmis nigricans]|uniref:Uncharacterized protein n=1 Tax=Ascodesmis nigricans TaxID=341454 RepID=A0A4S2N0E4_9PEZI|nr:hypothetical protein EX30DRAFT_184779 [Ascodesmis nigricans]
MSGHGEVEKERPTSLRRRFTHSLKKVISNSSSKKEAKTPEVASPTVETAPAKAEEKKPEAVEAPRKSISDGTVAKISSGRPTIFNRRTGPPPHQTAAERAEALFKKHGLEIQTSDWPMQSNAPVTQRVQKEIRMRVHRNCHKCETPYGSEKVCVKCGHKRCKQCPRYPTKKTKEDKKKAMEAKFGKKRKGDLTYGLTIPSRNGGPDLVRKPIRMRVHRKCHRCETDFAGEKVCSKCNHNRCKKCPREPSKNHKPPGYYDKYDPSDSEDERARNPVPRRTYKRPRRRVHWTCRKCGTTFLQGNKDCSGCGSHRDETGLRDPPKREKKEGHISTTELMRLGERLRDTKLSS